tara:strand:- start:365 stop:640 length:276 start_codon:yes stop_codon:yes gene_type:complete
MTITFLSLTNNNLFLNWTTSPNSGDTYGRRKGTLVIKLNQRMKQPELVREPSTTSDDDVLLILKELGLLLLTGPKDLNLPIMEDNNTYHHG